MRADSLSTLVPAGVVAWKGGGPCRKLVQYTPLLCSHVRVQANLQV